MMSGGICTLVTIFFIMISALSFKLKKKRTFKVSTLYGIIFKQGQIKIRSSEFDVLSFSLLTNSAKLRRVTDIFLIVIL